MWDALKNAIAGMAESVGIDLPNPAAEVTALGDAANEAVTGATDAAGSAVDAAGTAVDDVTGAVTGDLGGLAEGVLGSVTPEVPQVSDVIGKLLGG